MTIIHEFLAHGGQLAKPRAFDLETASLEPGADHQVKIEYADGGVS